MAQDTNAGARTPAKNSGPIFPFTEHLADFSQIAMTLPHMRSWSASSMRWQASPPAAWKKT